MAGSPTSGVVVVDLAGVSLVEGRLFPWNKHVAYYRAFLMVFGKYQKPPIFISCYNTSYRTQPCQVLYGGSLLLLTINNGYH